ncbi:MAG: glycoside hydrolase family 2 [Abditibacteriota bacterium]|nr:glycoside hydrolase family 2 [Abditibacteriota bacterium]
MHLLKFIAVAALCASCAAAAPLPKTSQTISLDGHDWLLCADAKNVGKDSGWASAPQKGCKKGRVPGIFQESLGDYHGVAWYYKTFDAPAYDGFAKGKVYLRFWAVDFKADIYLNGEPAGTHVGNEEMFLVDITNLIKPGAENLLAVRIVKPSYKQIVDDMELGEIPSRNQTDPIGPGSDYNYGGLTDSVELIYAPTVMIRDVYVKPDWKTGEVEVIATVNNSSEKTYKGEMTFTIAPAMSGEDIVSETFWAKAAPGETTIKTKFIVPNHKLWSLEEPNLYRLSAESDFSDMAMNDSYSTRFGFRDFRLEDGYFKLNGKRIFVKSNHSGGEAPVGIRVGLTEETFRKDLLQFKTMGFNMQRYIAGVGPRFLMDLADEIGILVFQESFAAWGMGWNLTDPAKNGSEKMLGFWDNETKGMILRDRNHPSVVVWSLLNENFSDPMYTHASQCLDMVTAIDDTRFIILNSGNFHVKTTPDIPEAMSEWRNLGTNEPNVTFNNSDAVMTFSDSHWEPRELTLHPGWDKQASVLRFTAPADGAYKVDVKFAAGAAKPTTSDVGVYVNTKEVFSEYINCEDKGAECAYKGGADVKKGEFIDILVGAGNNDPYSDTTVVDLKITAPDGKVYDAAKEFSLKANPNGVWSYGSTPANDTHNVNKVELYDTALGEGKTLEEKIVPVYANPGDKEWRTDLDDIHPYQGVPHRAEIINTLRTIAPRKYPVFISEYGVGSGMNLARLALKYDEIGYGDAVDAKTYKAWLEVFMKYWDNYDMGRIFASPNRFGEECIAAMAEQRQIGIDALRANPLMVAYSLTGGPDHGFTGEGIVTKFREYKPGTVDALSECFAPLRMCSFVEPLNAWNDAKITLEGVLVNEDVLKPGVYKARAQVVDKDMNRIYDKIHEVTVGKKDPFALPVFRDELDLGGCAPGEYTLYIDLLEGGAPTGGKTTFRVYAHPKPSGEGKTVALWSNDNDFAGFLKAAGYDVKNFADVAKDGKNLIVVTDPLGADFSEIYADVEKGSTVLFLKPDAVGELPLTSAGYTTGGETPEKPHMAQEDAWLYMKDDFALRGHPVFEGLPTGLLNQQVYREQLRDKSWRDTPVPDDFIAGCVTTSLGVKGGVTMGGFKYGKGMIYVNAMWLRENLSRAPLSDILILNYLKYLATK